MRSDLPEQLVIGTGAHGGCGPTHTCYSTSKRGVTVESLLTGDAVRRWRCWYRWVTLAMLACAFLVAAASPSTPATHHRWGSSR
jgi:hypothetical protein